MNNQKGGRSLPLAKRHGNRSDTKDVASSLLEEVHPRQDKPKHHGLKGRSLQKQREHRPSSNLTKQGLAAAALHIPRTSQPIVKGGLRRKEATASSIRTLSPIVKGGLRRKPLQGQQQEEEEKEREASERNVSNSFSEFSGEFGLLGQEEDVLVPPQATGSFISEEGLVIATPIKMESVSKLVEAEPVDLEAQEAQRSQRRKETQTRYVVAGLVALIILVAVAMSATFARKDREKIHLISSEPAGTHSPTQSPSPPPDPLAALRQDLPDYTRLSLKNPSSPQSKAYEWLLHHPNVTNLDEWRKLQIFAMVTFYYSFEGPFWAYDHRWMNQSKPECEWYFPYLDGSMRPCSDYGSSEDDLLIAEFRNPSAGDLPICDGFGQLTLLNLPMLALDGHSPIIPPEISLLQNLKYMYLQGNHMQVPMADMMPSQMGLLLHLEELRLDYNYLNGTIPSEIGLVTSLKELDLSENYCVGNIPTQIGDLTNLEILHLYNNALSGALPSEVGLLQSMWRLSIRGNAFTQALPSELGYLSLLEDFFLYDNFMERLPSELASMSSLKRFHAGNNSLSGTIPSELGSWPSIKEVLLHKNKLQKQIPTELGRWANIFMLSVRENHLTGSIPSELGLLNSTHSLFLSSNALTGTIPSSLGMSRFHYFYLDHCQLTGTIPHELLVENWMYLHNNLLTGSIPEAIASSFDIPGDCPTHRLSLANNILTGNIPSEVGMSTGLEYLVLDNNVLTNELPSEIFFLSNLEVLSVSNNLLSGRISSKIGFLSRLVELHLDGNEGLTGPAPHEITSLASNFSLVSFNVSGTNLSGSQWNELDWDSF